MVIINSIYQKIQKAPKEAGVYIFKNKLGEVLYIGKAISLKNRLSYYTKNENELYPKVAKFLAQAHKLSWIVVRNDLEAILLEMNLIRSLKPKYNAISKDDKRPLYVWITNDKFPRVKTARIEVKGKGDYFGPFPSGYKMRKIMKSLRKIFPYCSCNINRKKSCLYADLGLCKPSPHLIKTKKEASEYKSNIRRLKYFLSGKIDKVIKILEKEMKTFSDSQEFEKADEIKTKITDINYLLSQKHNIEEYLENSTIKSHLIKSQNKALSNLLGMKKIRRIEGYDIANTSGENSTASMVVFEDGLANTSAYKRFKIKYTKGPNDPQMIYETLLRRFNHDEWNFPDLILVDGGKGQVKAACKASFDHGLNIKVIGIAKRLEQLVFMEDSNFRVETLAMDSPALILLKAVRDEAHRFATNYHKKLRNNKLFINSHDQALSIYFDKS
jgi:excinuclease ABC subunit C